MVKTEEKYSDGSIVYVHECCICGVLNTKGTKNKKNPTCAKCMSEIRSKKMIGTSFNKIHGFGATDKFGKRDKNYLRWKNIKKRCYDKNNKRFNDWGGRGIIMEHGWDKNAGSFIEYILSLDNANTIGYSLDRINNDDNYKIGNLRWATSSIQCLNQRDKKTNTGVPRVSKYTERGKYVYFVVNGRSSRRKFKTIEEAISFRDAEFKGEKEWS